jgi:hypothetical protein
VVRELCRRLILTAVVALFGPLCLARSASLDLRDADRVVNDTEIVLRGAEDREITIPVNAIEEKQDGRSLMPDGSVDQLTQRDLVDLVRFLSELGGTVH